jgi:acetyl esterase/lipase
VSQALHPAPPLDPELSQLLKALSTQTRSAVTPEATPSSQVAVEQLIGSRPITSAEHSVPGLYGAPALQVTVFRRIDHTVARPGLLHLHGGAMIRGERFTALGPVLDWVEHLNMVVVTVEYRLAPQSSPTALVEDFYNSLVWLAEHGGEVGADPGRIIVAGSSSGGGLAAGVALMARDLGGPPLAGQVLLYPMLDDRGDTTSTKQIDALGPERAGNIGAGWDALLGQGRGGTAVSSYAAPARAQDLTGLPPAYIEVGSSEAFRDEVVTYASRIWACGGQAELHVWPGAFHAFDIVTPTAQLSQEARQTRGRWLARLLNADSTPSS